MAAPKVFISYSHDSQQHKDWVQELASFLVSNGVDVVLDGWNLRRGEDIPKFMEDGVTSADRVLMICTERYVEKADAASGGVGYEKMIVTAELIKNLGTSKFISVLRQSGTDRKVPKFMGGRYYIDLSEGVDFAAERQHLLRDLHNVPPDRPALGPSPFVAAKPASVHLDIQKSFVSSDPLAVYERAITVARSADIFSWRNLLSSSRDQITAGLADWLKKYATVVPPSDVLVAQSMEGIAHFAPLMAVSLGGIASTAQRFKDQTGVLDDILHPPDWQRGGLVIRVELPTSAAFIFQALHGAMCLYIEDAATALKFARTRTQSSQSREELPLWARHDVIMWPHSLGHNATAAWKVISTLPASWPWLTTLFGNLRDYQIALLSYYIALNTLEFMEYLAAGRQVPDEPSKLMCDIPPVFEALPDDVKRSAYRALLKGRDDLQALAAELKLDKDLIRRQWPKWVSVQKYSLHQLYPFATGLTQEGLIPEIFGK